MNAILGFSQLLLRDPEVPDHQRAQLTTVCRSGEHLMGIINDILEMARIESGRVTLDPTTFSLFRLLDDLKRMFSLRAQAKQLRFLVERQGEVPRYILTDETKLRQVIINLLGNAVKFTGHGGMVVLRVRTAGDADGRLRLYAEVADTGTGIAPEDLPRLFEPFFQTSTGKHVDGGTGLGLPISRALVQTLGGELTVSSRLGQGSTFRFDVQVARGEELAAGAGTTPPPRVLHLLPGVTCRVLVADDQPENCELLEQLLVPFGFEVYTAQDGREAVTQCQAWSPHVVLLDLRMPVMDGYEAAQRIRAAYGPAVKIIALSASVFAEHQQQALAAGADAFLTKPLREADLLGQIKRVTGLDYVYDDLRAAEATSSTESVAAAPSAEDLRQLPRELKDQLLKATCGAHYGQMLALVEQVAGLSASLGDRLRTLVKRFDYEALQALLSPADTGHAPLAAETEEVPCDTPSGSDREELERLG
jgi:CheY-like chemotaxis protein